MTQNPKQLMPLIYATESYEDVVRHLETVFEGLMSDIENRDVPRLTETQREHLKSAKNWAQTAAKYITDFEGGME